MNGRKTDERQADERQADERQADGRQADGRQADERQEKQKENTVLQIRKARREDLSEIMEIYEYARKFQQEHGNPLQWQNGYPSLELVRQDLERGELYVVCSENAGGEWESNIAGVFMFTMEPERDYDVIRDGEWLNEEVYGTVHRVAGNGTCRGIGKAGIDWAFARCKNLKMDTHEDNKVMQNLLVKNGFHYCGQVTIRGGETRMAYQKIE